MLNRPTSKMGKQTKRQRAKKAKAAAADAPMPANLCLPHCEEPGDKLECGMERDPKDDILIPPEQVNRFISELTEGLNSGSASFEFIVV